jgi:hypothetical protein
MRKALIAIASVAAIAALLVVGHQKTKAADHTDSPAASGSSNDIADVYAWMQGGGGKLNLAMTIANAAFSDATQYVFHINRSAGYGMPQTETLVLCQFTGAGADQSTECWVGDKAGGATFKVHVVGKASDEAAPLQDSADAPTLRVFAGPRKDPFFFNLDGFNKVATDVRATIMAPPAGVAFNADSCVTGLPDATKTALVNQLKTAVGGGPAVDAFTAPVAALVVQVNLDLLNGTGDILGVWASTNTK